MSTNELLQIHLLEQSNFNQATPTDAKLVAVKPDTTTPDVTKPDGQMRSDPALFLIPFCLTMGLTIVIFTLPDVWKLISSRIATINRFHQVPCKNCRFFTNNHYLLCTVHPSIALTKQALHCSDYYPKNEQ